MTRLLAVSKRCCPICNILVQVINQKVEPWIYAGSHSQYSMCTLPPWLPAGSADDVVSVVKLRLRALINQICEQSSEDKQRAKRSTESPMTPTPIKQEEAMDE